MPAHQNGHAETTELRRIGADDSPIVTPLPPGGPPSRDAMPPGRATTTFRSNAPASRPRPPSTPRPRSDSPCPLCDGIHGDFLTTLEVAQSARLAIVQTFGARALVICPQCEAGQRRARDWSRLPPEAASLRLADLRAVADQAAAVQAIAALAVAPRGWITLVGPFGTGKTTLLYAALTHLAAVGVFGVYTTAPELIEHLRDALRDMDGRAHSERLRRLADVPVLAIDELDKYRPTEYAEEAIFRLFDARYRAWERTATLIAYNDEQRIPGYLLSRIRDGRFDYFALRGDDLRPALATKARTPNDRH